MQAQIKKIEQPIVLLNGNEIEVASQGKIMGVPLSGTMSWQAQCKAVLGKL